MTLACTNRDRSAYATGRLAQGDARLLRPGGLELTARAISLGRPGAGARVLDLGCGAGDTVRALCSQGFDAVGVDCAADPAIAKESDPNATARRVARAEALPFADGSVDAILAECSLSLFEDRERALAECARVLVDGGRLMISDLYARQPDAIGQVRALHGSCIAGILVREELETELNHAGFCVGVFEDHSRALRECAARFLFEHGSLDGLWGCCGHASSHSVEAAMRAARAGYFLLVATRRGRSRKGERCHE